MSKQTKCGAYKNNVRLQKHRIMKMTQVYESKSIRQIECVQCRKAAGISKTLY